ncbi:hypothetical protein [Goodfellowiella coeruleoviolacea]|uniref:DUF3558 domain-containing protein n=1 Tax=Goodfellowiella coeruleoviolacea TaxID=334858 RepID=A0AAE3KIZ0_9PSEU|nr:hypothetical protein [Goodfellowiella coeruleoviolacea]MCP2169746.1 hypothetical protein [Goodfellowiella coeruleoviolacea]
MSLRVRRTLALAALTGAVALATTGCGSYTSGIPFVPGGVAKGTSDAGSGRTGTAATRNTPVPEAKQLPPVCDAVRNVVDTFGFPEGTEYEPSTAQGFEGGPGQTCSVSNEALYDDLYGALELSVTVALNAKGAKAMAEYSETYKSLSEDGGGGGVIDLPPADLAYLSPAITSKVQLYTFKSNIAVTVLYQNDGEPADQVLSQAKALAVAALEAVTYE